MCRSTCESKIYFFDLFFHRHEPRKSFLYSSQRGTTLIEVLVTLVLVAIGLSGMMAMQARGVQQNQSAYLRTQAVMMASDMADRIRLNRQAALAGDYALTSTQTVDNFKSTAGLSGGEKLAKNDLFDWLGRVNTYLPGGDATISLADQTITITLSWDGRRDDGNRSSYQHEVEL
ncbi:type IV pilus modification protein PilV [Amphritea sp. 2_MG-2023]|uniref:type IV pilus modification protein PilV n=1 Tax=Amphritea TaxID=515417 RepID=UPI001C065FF9|nr:MULTISPECIES: type IV pilus modification protein PilV [Amphritea]MBU2963987.1 type IV pilus modification protein PilV [Amphritea atlantica]MDO6420309.1 type IV pilus modification protein PilV [Amphritea sp. 2_MG-2023]